jgi:hypothetical protein
MSLTVIEKEQVSDTVLLIRSARKTLERLQPEKIPNFSEIQDCLASADKNLRDALQR